MSGRSRLPSRVRPGPHRAFVVATAAVLATTACGGEPAGSRPDGSARGSYSGQWGVADLASTSASTIDRRSERTLGRRADVVLRFVSLDLSAATRDSLLDQLARESQRGRTELVTLEPARSGSAITLSAIASGRADGVLADVGRRLARVRGPVVLRFAHEMNGSWYPWAGDPAAYLTAWSRVRSTVQHYAPQVRMMWSVSVEDRPAGNQLESYWPGGDLVDAVGLDGYNCLSGWREPSALFDDALARVRQLAPATPVWISETASCESTSTLGVGESKARWIQRLFAWAQARRIAAVVWFDRDKEFDWRYDTSRASAAALRDAVRRP